VPQRCQEGGKGAKLRGESKTGLSYAVGSSQAVKAGAVGCVVAAIEGALGVRAASRAD